MSPFDVILFDVGGVLLTDGWDEQERKAGAERFNLNAGEMETRNARVMAAWDRDEMDLKHYLDETVFYEPRPFTHGEFFDYMIGQSRLLPDGAISVLAELHASNRYLLGSLNNEPREMNEFRLGKFGLRQLFKVAFSSCYLGLRKPDPAIFHRVLDILGRPASRILFIDDRDENIVAAAAAGLKTIHFKGQAALRGELANLGVLGGE